MDLPFGRRGGFDDSVWDPFKPFVAYTSAHGNESRGIRTIVHIGPDPWGQ